MNPLGHKTGITWYNRGALLEDRATQGCDSSATQCAGWRQPYSYRLMPGRDAVAGISLFGVKLLSGVAFWPQCDKPIAPSSTSRILSRIPLSHCRRHCGGTVGRLLLRLLRHCRRHCRPTVGGDCQWVQYSSDARCYGLWRPSGAGRDYCRILLAPVARLCYTLLSTLTQKKWGVYP